MGVSKLSENSMHVFNNFTSIFVTLLFLGGCSLEIHHTPNSSTYELDTIPEFSSVKTITLGNNQASNVVLIRTIGGHKHYGDLQIWTDTAIEITQRELTKRGMNVVTDSPKTLGLSIETVEVNPGFWVVRCDITLKVETSEGYVYTYMGDGTSQYMHRTFDGAIMRAVAEMLRDNNIVAYLKK